MANKSADYTNGLCKQFELTEKQKEIVRKIIEPETKLVFIDGPAGTSKTYLATYSALKLLKNGVPSFDSLLYIRNNVECAAKTFGILPGDMQEKFQPWSMPLDDKLSELLHSNDISKLKSAKQIEAAPINYLRGASFRNRVIIVDEAQNMHENEFITTLTRIGENCKVIIIGDSMQIDIKQSYFSEVLNAFSDEKSKEHGIYQFQLTANDIVRSKLVKYIVEKLTKLTTHIQ